MKMDLMKKSFWASQEVKTEGDEASFESRSTNSR
jgi:hypothetical protein